MVITESRLTPCIHDLHPQKAAEAQELELHPLMAGSRGFALGEGD